MALDVRVTVNVAKVLRVFLADPAQHRFGYDLMKQTNLPSGSLYPVLARLERSGWIIGEFEQINERDEERPARRLYRFTPEGRERGQLALAELHEKIRFDVEN